uniref:Uncharacterized protein n=1 Tax=Cacopsylla melanoneura TaxID=428564 RepID=A0A8D9F434_9HEMI
MVARSNIFDLAGRSATTLLNTLTTPGVPPVGHSCLYVMDRHRWYIRVCTEWTGCTTGEHLTLPTSILRVPPMVHDFEFFSLQGGTILYCAFCLPRVFSIHCTRSQATGFPPSAGFSYVT